MKSEKLMLEKLLAVGNMITQIKDIDILMETILTEARKLVNADAGSIYKRVDDKLSFSYTQNDTQQRVLPPGKKLIYNTFSMPINDKSISGYVALTAAILNIPDVYALDSSVPYSFNPAYDQKSGYRTVSMLTIPLRTNLGKVIGVLQLINAKDDDERVIPFREDDIPFIQSFANSAAVALERAAMTRDMILRMISMAELRDPKETGAHVNRVGAYSAELYETWAGRKALPADEVNYNKDLLRVAAMLHDVGKVGISDAILKKPGKLTDEEFDTMKTHPFIGARLFADQHSELDQMSMQIALSHHERWDGRGYPGYIDIHSGLPLPEKTTESGRAMGMKAEETPIWARIVAIADVYDALSSRRSYKEPWTQDNVFEELEKSAGTQFDPELIEIFLSVREEVQSIRQKYPDLDEK
ncbi:MAG: GAF domain-containing protein [Candidatus Cloacimonadaceae bacterium]|nr:GAF domain-containing protein [Candidatus Cloacimonadaceae bacterium]